MVALLAASDCYLVIRLPDLVLQAPSHRAGMQQHSRAASDGGLPDVLPAEKCFWDFAIISWLVGSVWLAVPNVSIDPHHFQVYQLPKQRGQVNINPSSLAYVEHLRLYVSTLSIYLPDNFVNIHQRLRECRPRPSPPWALSHHTPSTTSAANATATFQQDIAALTHMRLLHPRLAQHHAHHQHPAAPQAIAPPTMTTATARGARS